jgi:hypothetical protein
MDLQQEGRPTGEAGALPPTILSDLAEEGGDQLWSGLATFAERLARIVGELPVTSPILLNGDWGAGKTTTLLAMKRALEAEPLPRKVIWFDAWRYEGQGALLPSLVRAVWNSTPDAFRDRRESRERFHKVWRATLAVSARLLPFVFAFIPGGQALAAIKTGADELNKDLVAVGATSSGAPVPEPSDVMWAEFAALVRDAWGDRPPIIFVDDLDRCSPEGAVALLDGIRIMVGRAEEVACRYVVALDRKVLAHAVGTKFRDISGYDAHRYLEKVFPLTFSVPQPDESDCAALVGRFLSCPADEPQGRNHRDALSLVLGGALFSNPRLIKRCINRFRLVVYFESMESSRVDPLGGGERDRALAKWLAAIERWPTLRSLARHKWKEWSKILSALDGQGREALDSAVQELLRAPGIVEWLRLEIRDERNAEAFREAEARLRRWGM